MNLRLIEAGQAVPFLVEESAYAGVKRIAEVVADDICLVTDVRPAIASQPAGKRVILCATLGHSALTDALEKAGKFDASAIRGKREVYRIAFVEKPFDGVESALVICGSDKRGTIYGMFALSEYLGVTSLVYLGDSAPAKCADPVIGGDIETVSKEPSVRFRGFFINDEWPCFGNWAMEHFGGVNAQMYENIFIFLLRMKGNYMWPAMWASSFPLDGPGSANEELADMLGVVMGYSHHEPCLRASEEWDKVRGEGTRYGNEWNFYTNEQGLLRYWEDSLKRSGKYENIITIGMRGERDSSMLGDHSTVEENVNLLKDIIRKQRQLIRSHVNDDLSEVPQMLALYKEVEAYFYGDDKVAGLKDWDELDGVICMLCEDNHGQMRTLPTPEIRDHKGGFGMYYHFDYHGGPISYEWVDSTPLSKTWEQMCNAYEYGIRDLWIVNVGDLKFHEVPLTYFMALAYDYEKWGSSNKNSYREYAALWAKTNFREASAATQEKLAKLLLGYIDMNHNRRPESLNENIYHAFHYLEADRMLAVAEGIEALDEEIRAELPASELDGYYSMVGFPATASANLLKMHLYAAKSAHYAKQGRCAANRYADLAEECIAKDREYADSFGRFLGGKWNGMQLAQHIGFTKWNDDGWRYPVICRLTPAPRTRMSVSRKDGDRACVRNYGAPETILVHDFMDEGVETVILEVSADGAGSIHYTVTAKEGAIPAWLTVTEPSGEAEDIKDLVLSCDRSLLPDVPQKCTLLICDGETTVAAEVMGVKHDLSGLPAMTFLPKDGVFVINADHYAGKTDVPGGAFEVIDGYGKYGVGVKVSPATAFFTEEQDRPKLTYRVSVPETGFYRVRLLAAPTNPAVNGQGIRVTVCAGGCEETLTLVASTFQAGANWDPVWCRGVLDQIRETETMMKLEAGVNEITIGALEAGLVLERIVLVPDRKMLPNSYFGPQETAYRK